MASSKNPKYRMRLSIILCIGLVIGAIIGLNFHSIPIVPYGKNDTKKLREVLSFIETEYVDEVETETLVDGAIQNMLAKLDPHSAYINVKERKQANEDLQGSFEGIGIEFNIFQDTLVVVTPLSGGPAESAGLRAGDKIVEIDNENVAGVGLTNREVVKKLKGPKGIKVTIRVLRKYAKELILFTLIRDKIPRFSVDAAYMLDANIGYIKISRFSQTTYSEFERALDTLQSIKMTQLILDLQGNPGGYMEQAIKLADEFLPAGKKIVYTKGKESRYNSEAISSNRGKFEEGDIIVLIDEGSSSASEIVAGALQDNDRALIVGRRSYGKGLVQSPFDLSDGSELRLTVSRYYTPSGRSIQKPYDNYQEYSKDIAKRYDRGEFFHADSIHFDDSLKYLTPNGRTVYGGGGIMPDYFVPFDTLFNNSYVNALFSSNAFQEYVFNYTLENTLMLEKMGYTSFRKNFKITDSMIANLIHVGTRNGVKDSPKNLSQNRIRLDALLKANIARRVWGNKGFYPIVNDTNKVVQQAMYLFQQGTEPLTRM